MNVCKGRLLKKSSNGKWKLILSTLVTTWLSNMHRIRFETWGFVPMSYFYSETNELKKDWAKQWALPWLATNSRQFHRNFISLWKKWLVAAQNLQCIKTLFTLELSQYCKSGRMFSSSEPAATASAVPLTWKRPGCPVFVRLSYLRKQSRRAAPRAWPLISPSKPSIIFWNSLQTYCQMTCRGSKLDSNLNCAAWPTRCKGFIASEITA